MLLRRPVLLLAFSASVAAWSFAQSAPTGKSSSPFMPPGGSPVAPQNDAGTHELVGVISSGKDTLVGITDRSTRKSLWIPVGKSLDGIEVISYEPKQDTATLRIAGMLKVVTMKAPAPANTAPSRGAPVASTVPTMSAPPAPQSPTPAIPAAQAEQEREARMLVSDLLEIGIQQRKAYEEAQRKAAQQKSAGPQAPAPKP
jgi:hypothetical protein